MKIQNKLYNWWHQVKRVNSKDSRNAGKMKIRNEWVIVKYDWSKPFRWVTKKYQL